MICSECARLGKKSQIRTSPSVTTLMGVEQYYDERGFFHNHDPNITTILWQCSNGHAGRKLMNNKCSYCDYGNPESMIVDVPEPAS